MLVYCHAYDGVTLTLGALCDYVNDARTNIHRQQIHKDAFLVYNPQMVDINCMHKYVFLENQPDVNDYSTINERQDTLTNYIVGATVLLDLPQAIKWKTTVLPTEN